MGRNDKEVQNIFLTKDNKPMSEEVLDELKKDYKSANKTKLATFLNKISEAENRNGGQ